MKRCIAGCLLLMLALFCLASKGQNKFESMVDASVLIYDDNGHGSGVFIKDNVILTAAHCLIGKDSLKVELVDGTVLESSDFYIDEEEDVGFIFVEADELSIANMSRTPVELGDDVYTVGTPHSREYKFTLMKGIISYVVGRDMPNLNWESVLQADIDGGAGMSGGPLYNHKGDLIGIYNGQVGFGGYSISFCEDLPSIERAYERYKEKS